MIDQLAADLGQRLGLGAGAIPDGHVVAGLDEPLGHGKPHAAGADPADFLFVVFAVRGHPKLPARCFWAPSYHRMRCRVRERARCSPAPGVGRLRYFLTWIYRPVIRTRAQAGRAVKVLPVSASNQQHRLEKAGPGQRAEHRVRTRGQKMFAVFKTGGKQYRVAAEDVLKIDKVKGEPGEIVEFGEVLVVGGDSVTLGRADRCGRYGRGRGARPGARAEGDRLQEAPAEKFAPQARSSAGIHAAAHYRDSDRRQEGEPDPAAAAEAGRGAEAPTVRGGGLRRVEATEKPRSGSAKAKKAKSAGAAKVKKPIAKGKSAGEGKKKK